MNGARLDFIADTTAIVCLLRGDSQVELKVKGKNIGVAYVTLAELQVGILKASKPEATRQRFIEVLAGKLAIYPNEETPIIYGHIYHELEKRGQRIPVNDVWIAAIAVQFRLPLLARDEHFSRVPGLSVIKC